MNFSFVIIVTLTMTKKYATIDLELINNTDITAIGVYSGDDKGDTYAKEEFWIKKDLKDFDERCKEQFWDKHPELYKLVEEGGDEKTQVESFLKLWDGLAKELGVKEEEINLISDNAECDYGRLNQLVMKYAPKRGPIRFTTTGQYRSIDGYDSAFWKLGVDKIVNAYASKIQEHDHRPSNDAHHSHVSYLIQGEILEEIKNNYKDEKGRKFIDVVNEVSERVLSTITRPEKRKRNAAESIREILHNNKKKEEVKSVKKISKTSK